MPLPMPRASLLRLSLVLFLAAAGAHAQEPATLVLETNAPHAVVLANGVVLGRADDSGLHLPMGDVELVLMEDAIDAWEPRRVAATVSVQPGDTVRVALDLPIRYRIETLPVGASIALETAAGETALGRSPLVLDEPAPLSGMLIAHHPGFMPARLVPGDSLTNRHTLLLRPLEAGAVSEASVDWMPPRRRANVWIDVAAAGLALAAAGVAVHYKFRADAVDNQYRAEDSAVRGDPALKAEAERLDGYALGALGVMQVGVGVLAVRFILR